MKNKKGTINPKNKDNKCFKYAITVALNHEKIKKDPQIIWKIEPFMSPYEWKNINFQATSKDWKSFEQDNKTIALNILFVPYNTKQIRLAYKSKYNYKRDNQVILLMMTDGEKWHYLAVKNLSPLLIVITSNHKGDFYCLNCFRSYRTKEEKLKKHEKVCNYHDYCYVEMPDEYNKILKYNHGEKSLKASFMVYADLEYLLEKIHSCQNNLKKSYTGKKANHTPSGYSWFTCCSFDESKNELGYYRGKDCMEKFCKDLRENAMKIVNYEKKKKMILLTDKETEFCENQKVCHICKKEFSTDKNDKNTFELYHKIRDHCHYTKKFRGAAHSICNLKYKTPKEIPVVFRNGSTYDYHFIIKQLVK